MRWGLRRLNSAFDIINEHGCQKASQFGTRGMKCVYTRDVIFFIVSESALRITHRNIQAHGKKAYQKWHNFSLFDFLEKMPATLHNQPKYENALRYFMSDRVRISISYNASTRQIRQGQAVLLPSMFATRCKQKACQEHAVQAHF